MISSTDDSTAIKRATLRKMLPIEYVLSNNDVQCGRGQACFNHPGNVKFKTMVMDNLDRYMKARTKYDKTMIVYEIIDEIRKNSPGGGFVQKESRTGRYYEVGDFLAVSKFFFNITVFLSLTVSHH